MESENIEEVIQEDIQEGGATIRYDDNYLLSASSSTTATLSDILRAGTRANGVILNARFRVGGLDISDRPLLLSDLASLIVGGPVATRTIIQTLFDNIPLAQYKHLPDPRYLSLNPTSGGGNVEESTLDTQEVSLPSEASEEDLPSLDIVEPSSTGGSYKRSSHKKRKSTRSRTKKNKKL